jgi:uncharacterized membrane protein YgcG
MNIRTSIALIVLAIPLAGMVSVAGAQTTTQTQQRIYGSQMMTQQEMNEYRERMRLAKTEEERERIRADHHARMSERAKARGITLPDEPPAKARSETGTRMAPGSGMGSGGGSGGGGGGGGGR